MTWDHATRGKAHWVQREDGQGDWAYTCPTCHDTGWTIDAGNNAATPCECTRQTAPMADRPHVSSSWPWVKHEDKLRYRVTGDRTFWIYGDGRMVVYHWQGDRIESFEPELVLANLYEQVYNRRSTRRTHPGADDYYAK